MFKASEITASGEFVDGGSRRGSLVIPLDGIPGIPSKNSVDSVHAHIYKQYRAILHTRNWLFAAVRIKPTIYCS